MGVCYYSPIMALLRRNASRLGLLVLLAVGLGCLFFLFELFVGVASPGSGDLPAGDSSPETPFRISGGSSFIAMLAAATCLALGAGAILLLWKAWKAGPKRPLWVTACGGAAAAAMLGLGIYLAVSAARRGGLPYGEVPSTGHQVDLAGIETVGLTVLATLVLLVMLVGVTKPRLVALPLLLLVANLALGLAGASVIRNLELFDSPSTLQPEESYARAVTEIRGEYPFAIDEALAGVGSEKAETGDSEPSVGIPPNPPPAEGSPEGEKTSGESKLLPDIARAIADLLNSVDPVPARPGRLRVGPARRQIPNPPGVGAVGAGWGHGVRFGRPGKGRCRPGLGLPG